MWFQAFDWWCKCVTMIYQTKFDQRFQFHSSYFRSISPTCSSLCKLLWVCPRHWPDETFSLSFHRRRWQSLRRRCPCIFYTSTRFLDRRRRYRRQGVDGTEDDRLLDILDTPTISMVLALPRYRSFVTSKKNQIRYIKSCKIKYEIKNKCRIGKEIFLKKGYTKLE